MHPSATISPARRAEVIGALRRGTVPRAGLDLFAVGMERFERAIDEELDGIAAGRAAFKAVRGEYGAGKTFLARWLAERAKRRGMAAAEVQISETETPLHKLETVYRRLVEQLSTAAYQPSALREVIDSWFYTLEEDVLAEGKVAADDAGALAAGVDALLERRLADVARTTPAFAAALRAYRQAAADGDQATAQALLAWIGGQPNVAAAAKRTAGVKGDLDHFAALGFLQGLLTILRDSGHPGLHPTLAYHLVSTLGWTTLRPLQRAAMEPVLRGDDALLLAPTAGGKTEAAAFPVLTRMSAEYWTGLSVLYLCPLKALLNNLLPRLELYGGWAGRRVALWPGGRSSGSACQPPSATQLNC